MDAKQPIYTPSSLVYRVASYLVGQPLWWALEQLSLVGGDETEGSDTIWKRVQGDYIVLANLEVPVLRAALSGNADDARQLPTL